MFTVSSGDTIGAFNTGFDTVNLHRPTLFAASALKISSRSADMTTKPLMQGLTLVHFSAQRKQLLWDTMGA